jgi:hypothetical protein
VTRGIRFWLGSLVAFVVLPFAAPKLLSQG